MIRKFPLQYIYGCIMLLAGVMVPGITRANGLALTLINYTVQTNQGNIDQGRTFTINATLTNLDTAVFTGQLSFGLRSGAAVLTNQPGVFKTPPFTGNTIVLNSGESVPCIFSVKVEPQYFAPGPAVVVVWPISTAPIADSIIIGIQVNNPLSVPSTATQLFTYIVYNNKIMLAGTAPETDFKQVRIYTLNGQLISAQTGHYITEIPLGTLPKGVYVCELLTADNRREVIKFVH